MKKNRKPLDKSLTPEQCAKLLAVAEGEMKGLILVALTTGQQLRDIIALKRIDVDMIKGLMHFHIGKTGVTVEITLDPRVRMWIEQQPESIVPMEADTPLLPQLACRGAVRTSSSPCAKSNCYPRMGIVVPKGCYLMALVCVNYFLVRKRAKTSRGAGGVLHSTRPPAVEVGRRSPRGGSGGRSVGRVIHNGL